MSHVDEGLIHAYLDGAFPPGSQQGEEIEAHLEVCVDCRVLLEKAREVKERAQLVMHRLAPPVVTAPPFDEILARRERSRAAPAAGGTPAAAEPAASGAASRRRLLPPLPLAWAATLILAVGAGWMVRAYMGPAGLDVGTSTESGALDAASPAPPPPALQDARLRLPPVSGEGSASAAAEPPPAAPAGGRAEQGAVGETGQAQRADQGADRELSRAQRARAEAPVESRALAATVATVQADTGGGRPAAAAPPPTVSLFGDAKATIQVAAESIDLARTTLPVADLLRAYARATAERSWQREPIAEPIGTIGYERVARLEGAQALRTERATVDVTELMRTVYVIDGDSVELIQRMHATPVALESIIVTGVGGIDSAAANRRPLPAGSGRVDTTAAGRAVTVTNEPTVTELETTTRVIRPLRIVGRESAVFEGHGVMVVSEGGRQAVLKGPLDPARLQTLAADVRR